MLLGVSALDWFWNDYVGESFGPSREWSMESCANTKERTWLYYAAQKGDLSTVKLLITNGADLNVCYARDSTALHAASAGGDEAVVGFLLENSADVSIQDEDGNTALFLAALGGFVANVRLLLEKGVDLKSYQ